MLKHSGLGIIGCNDARVMKVKDFLGDAVLSLGTRAGGGAHTVGVAGWQPFEPFDFCSLFVTVRLIRLMAEIPNNNRLDV